MELSIQAKPVTEKIFLIDFENVHEKGLEGIGQLGPQDTVHLFYTKNASKISLDILSEIQAKLKFHKVNVGKQSLDMQLVSYLGFLIGTIGKEPEYIIVSNDTGFVNTLAFWGEKDTKISQMKSMNFTKPEEAAHPVQVPVRATSGRTASGRSPYRARSIQMNQHSSPVSPAPVQAAVTAPAPAASVVPAQPAAAPVAAKQTSQSVPATVPAGKTAPQSSAIAEEASPVHPQETPVSHPPVRGATEKTQINNKITVALRDRKVEGEKIGKATGAVMKLYGTRNFRQAAYREIIKLFGQKEGLEIYNIIRSILTPSGKPVAKASKEPAGSVAPAPAAPAAESPASAD